LTFELLTSKLKGNIFLPWIVYVCDMVTLDDKDNCLEPGNCISTLMSTALDLLTSKSIGNIFLLWVVHMCDMVTLGGKDNCLVAGGIKIKTIKQASCMFMSCDYLTIALSVQPNSNTVNCLTVSLDNVAMKWDIS
jgi:hypothetical protein